ncbi:MAG: DUF3575 domain-containing protein, partial [Prevotellaceae bacterium]|nr:DUF3575 domain-containing protein [Prevotellaceae bacterium]
MKIPLLLVFFFFVATMAASAQQARMSLVRGEMSLSEFIGEVKRQTGTVVVFDAGNVPAAHRVSLPTGERSVIALMNRALPKSKYAWRTIGNYIVVRTLPTTLPSDAAAKVEPTKEDFERDLSEYTRRIIMLPEEKETVIVGYDTVRTEDTVRVEKAHSGSYTYPGATLMLANTDRTAYTAYLRNTPPRVALKTNLLWWAARGTFNGAIEGGVGKKTSLELSGGINRWNLKGTEENNKKLAHWVVKPEFRYWLCERFNGHFFGLHAIYAQYNVGGYDVPLLFEKEYRYEGDAYGAGLSY